LDDEIHQYACVSVSTITRLSIYGQYLHLIGSVSGFVMLIFEQDFSFIGWLLSVNSFAQTSSIYLLAVWFEELRLGDVSMVALARDGGGADPERDKTRDDRNILLNH
jgi:hypothetical protein